MSRSGILDLHTETQLAKKKMPSSKKSGRDDQDSVAADVDVEEQIRSLCEQLESAQLAAQNAELAASEANRRCQEAEEKMAAEQQKTERQELANQEEVNIHTQHELGPTASPYVPRTR